MEKIFVLAIIAGAFVFLILEIRKRSKNKDACAACGHSKECKETAQGC